MNTANSYSCPKCLLQQDSEQAFRTHYSAEHLYYAPYWCGHCKYRFCGEDELVYHSKRKHPELQENYQINCHLNLGNERLMDTIIDKIESGQKQKACSSRKDILEDSPSKTEMAVELSAEKSPMTCAYIPLQRISVDSLGSPNSEVPPSESSGRTESLDIKQDPDEDMQLAAPQPNKVNKERPHEPQKPRPRAKKYGSNLHAVLKKRLERKDHFSQTKSNRDTREYKEPREMLKHTTTSNICSKENPNPMNKIKQRIAFRVVAPKTNGILPMLPSTSESATAKENVNVKEECKPMPEKPTEPIMPVLKKSQEHSLDFVPTPKPENRSRFNEAKIAELEKCLDVAIKHRHMHRWIKERNWPWIVEYFKLALRKSSTYCHLKLADKWNISKRLKYEVNSWESSGKVEFNHYERPIFKYPFGMHF